MLLRNVLFIAYASLFISLNINNAHAGFFDDLKKKAEETGKEIQGKTKDLISKEKEPPSDNKIQNKTSPIAQYDVVQVKAIQERLNELGYSQEEPDGELGSKTRSAIKQFESDQGLAVTGEPSAGLLGRMESVYVETGKNVQGANDNFPEPTLSSITLAALHFDPTLLNDETTLKNVVLQVHPDYGKDVANEFKWRKNKEKYRQEMLARAKSAQLEFEVLPWRRGSASQARRIQLVKYDFDKEAFRVRFSTGPKQITPKMFLSGTAEPNSKYETTTNYINVDLDTAEKVDEYFSGKQRNVYPAYKLRATGIDTSKHRPSPIVEFVDDQLSLYALTSGGNFASNYKFDYEPLLEVKLPKR